LQPQFTVGKYECSANLLCIQGICQISDYWNCKSRCISSQSALDRAFWSSSFRALGPKKSGKETFTCMA
jgi:hypothetical protein